MTKGEKGEKELDWKDYVAFIIAMLTTTLFPFILFALILLVIVLTVIFLGVHF